MKKTFTILASVLLGLLCNAVAQPTCTVKADTWEQITITYTTDQLSVEGETWLHPTIPGYMPSSRVGAPELPTSVSLIEVPLCKGYRTIVSDATFDTINLSGGKVWPTQAPRSKSDTTFHQMAIDSEIYLKDAFYGEPLATVEAVGIARDRNLARIIFSPVRYNPATNQLVVCRKATITVAFIQPDREATLAMFERYHSPAFNNGATVLNDLYPKAVRTTAPVRYLIVANSMFRGQLDEFVNWKRRKGFITDIVYTDEAAVGTTTESIQTYLQSQYTNATTASPAPTYVLLVGDVAQLPTFNAQVTSPSTGHVTDLYYMTWTSGDHIPDCHYGRFSAQNVAQLTPQVQKTLMYEQYTFADPSFLDRAVMVAGVDGGNSGDYGYTHADPAMDYAVTNYVNGAHGFANVYYFKNNTSITPTGVTNVTVSSSASGNAATVRAYYNLGAGFINYSAHGGSTGWGTPNFGNSHVNQMTNTQKFGLMIGNCCLTNKFEENTCFGEALLRKDNYCGAVGYIGGSNYTYWGQDFYWAVGVRSSISATMSMAYNASNLGVYDCTFHTHGESYSNWCITQGSMLMRGNMTVEASSSSSSMKHYYWEIYHLMGDPSVMPYMTQPDTMTIAVNTTLPYGTSTLNVTAAPYAYIALTDTVTGTLIAAAYATSVGTATLTLPAGLSVGSYLLAASAQQYRTAFRTIRVIQPAGAYPVVTSITSAPLNASDTVALTLHLENPGDATAHNITVSLASSTTELSFSSTTASLDSLPAGATADITTIMAYVASSATDNSVANISTSTTWTGGSLAATSTIRLTLCAPVLSISFSNEVPCILPGSDLSLTATLHNNGHAPSYSLPLTLNTPTSLLSVTTAATAPFAIAPSTDATITIVLHADNTLPLNITVPLSYSFGSLTGYLPVYVGQSFLETFEGGTTNLPGWIPNVQYPWAIIDSQAFAGTSCMRSALYMGHSQTSDVSMTVNVTVADSITFYYRVSSEQNYDKFHFLIDSVSQFNASGEVDWTRAAVAISAGSHTITFRYSKDGSVSNGSDCAWIDQITIPAPRNTINFSQIDLCQGDLRIIGTDTIGAATGNFPIVDGNTLVEYTVHPTYSVSTALSACDSLEWEGQTLTSDYSFDMQQTTVFGCDSSVHINIIINHTTYDTLTVNTQASSYRIHGHTYTESGIYTDTLTNANGCDSLLTLIITFTQPSNGIDEAESDIVSVYPSPTTGRVLFSAEVNNAELYNMQGQRLSTFRHTRELDLSGLPVGVYFLRIDGAIRRIELIR